MGALRPRRLFVIETELWPHWLLSARAASVPVAIVSARLSPRSVPRYGRLGEAFRSLVAGLEGVLCQTSADAARWRALGARFVRTTVVGNLKDDALPEPVADRAAARAARGLDPDRPLLVLGNMRPGEAKVIARAWQELPEALRATWQVVAVTRHPSTIRGLREEAEKAGAYTSVHSAPIGGSWRWDHRLGVLGGYYSACDVAIVGGTFAPFGGHNPLEPAAYGAAVVVGPHHGAQAEAVAALKRVGGARVVEDAVALAAALRVWLEDPALRAAAGAAALGAVRERRGAAGRAVARLAEWGLWPPGGPGA
jgi:3-deoxy-D-manno-octulosonic-acid transferase